MTSGPRDAHALAPPKLWPWFVAMALRLATNAWAADTPESPPPPSVPLRLAFSTGVIGEINHNDAKASIMAWGKAVLAQRSIAVSSVEPSLFERPQDLFRAMQEGLIDGAAVMTNEFLARPPALAPDFILLSLKRGKATVQYVLLVHQAGGIASFADLAGRSLELHKSAGTSLAGPWLDVCLAQNGLGTTESVFKKINRSEKVSRAVLRVFFRQADAVVVTRDAFETMCELNPQVRKELHVLATSPEVVPTVFFLRPSLNERLRQDVEHAMLTVHDTVSGRQALTVFQGDQVQKGPLSSLQGAIELVEAAARIRALPVPSDTQPTVGTKP